MPEWAGRLQRPRCFPRGLLNLPQRLLRLRTPWWPAAPKDRLSVPYLSVTGVSVLGVLCPVRLEHPDLGSFPVEVGFAKVCLKRNLLGRDFLGHIQLGLREQRQEFYVKAEPWSC